jgi:two-component system chemotaxis sensor kinase CheA
MVREILPIEPGDMQEVGGRATMVVRGEVLPVYPLAATARLAAEAITRSTAC